MIKKTITFPDIEGKMVTEEWWFNLNKGDIVELAVGNEIADRIRTISEASETGNVDAKTVIPAFKDVLSMSVGKRVNNKFMRSREITAEFMGSEAYSELIVELLSNAEAAAEFVNNLMPAGLTRQFEELQPPSDKKPSHEELLSMSDKDFYAAVGADPRHWDKDVLAIAMKRKTAQAA